MNTESPNSVIQSHDAEWNSKTDWDNKTLPPCWFHLLNEIEGVCVECGCPAMSNTHPILKGKAICDVCWDSVDPPKEEEERYCDNEVCPYGGYIYDEELEKYKGKEYVCVGCETGKGLQEREQEEDKDQHWGSAMSILLYGKEAE